MSFFSNREQEEISLKGQETVVNTRKAAESEEEEQPEQIFTELSLHPDWEIDSSDQEIFEKLNNELKELKPNQLALAGIQKFFDEASGDHTFYTFIRHTMTKKAAFKQTVIELWSKENTLLGRKEFDLAELGEIPPRSSRPWILSFSPKDLFTEDLPESGWKLVFRKKASDQPHELALTPSWNKRLSSENKRQLRQVVRRMNPPKPGEINFKGLKAVYLEERGELHVTLLIRNGRDKAINLGKLPLQVEDAAGDTVAKGGFELSPKLQVKPHTSTPWNFVFPASMILKKDPDLSRWKAYPPRKKE